MRRHSGRNRSTPRRIEHIAEDFGDSAARPTTKHAGTRCAEGQDDFEAASSRNRKDINNAARFDHGTARSQHQRNSPSELDNELGRARGPRPHRFQQVLSTVSRQAGTAARQGRNTKNSNESAPATSKGSNKYTRPSIQRLPISASEGALEPYLQVCFPPVRTDRASDSVRLVAWTGQESSRFAAAPRQCEGARLPGRGASAGICSEQSSLPAPALTRGAYGAAERGCSPSEFRCACPCGTPATRHLARDSTQVSQLGVLTASFLASEADAADLEFGDRRSASNQESTTKRSGSRQSASTPPRAPFDFML